MVITLPKWLNEKGFLKKQRSVLLFLECRSNGITFQDGDSLPNRDCTQMCKCGRGFLVECSPIVIPACPPKGCFPEEDFRPFTKELQGCPTPCSQCPSGKTVISYSSSFDTLKIASKLYLSISFYVKF